MERRVAGADGVDVARHLLPLHGRTFLLTLARANTLRIGGGLALRLQARLMPLKALDASSSANERRYDTYDYKLNHLHSPD